MPGAPRRPARDGHGHPRHADGNAAPDVHGPRAAPPGMAVGAGGLDRRRSGGAAPDRRGHPESAPAGVHPAVERVDLSLRLGSVLLDLPDATAGARCGQLLATGDDRHEQPPEPDCVAAANDYALAFLWGRTFQVRQVHAVDQLFEDREFVFLFFFFFGEDAGLVENVLRDEDGTGHSYGERDGVTWPGVDLDFLAVDGEKQPGKEDLVRQRRHLDLLEAHLGTLQNIGQQVVRDRTFRGDARDLQRDRVGLVDADPDGQITVGLFLFQNHDVLPAGHVHTDGVDLHFDEFSHPEFEPILSSGFSVTSPLSRDSHAVFWDSGVTKL